MGSEAQQVPILCLACYCEDDNMGYRLLAEKDAHLDEVTQSDDLGAPSYFHRCPGFVGARCGNVWYSECCPSFSESMLGLCNDCYDHDVHGGDEIDSE